VGGPTFLNYIHHIFPRGPKKFYLVTGLIKTNNISFLGMLRRELCLWPLAKKLYYGWISTMTSSNKVHENWPPRNAPLIGRLTLRFLEICSCSTKRNFWFWPVKYKLFTSNYRTREAKGGNSLALKFFRPLAKMCWA